jgi:glycosyltransferase involved in cell wall biosynthesis
MITGEDIIYVGNRWFGENKTSAHHIAEVLGATNRILYVEATGQRAPRASKRDLMQIFRLVGKVMKRPTRINDNFHVYSPIILPFHRFRFVRWLNSKILKFNVARVSRSLGFDNPLLWIFMPHYGSLAKNLPAKGVVYYITDEYSSHPNANVEVIKQLELMVLERADVVFAVSQELLERKSEFNANCYLSLHGVDLARFQNLDREKIPPPPDMAAIPSPIAGFIGFIEEWIDIELLHHIATRHPEVSLVLIGKAMQDVSLIQSLPNVYLLGHKPFIELPAYLAHMDVGLLPYRLNTQVINSNPKKLREYLAAGKPIVSVRVREVERYAELVRIADDYEAYAEAIRRAIDEDSPAQRATRVEAMKDESWERRVDDVSSIVARHVGVRNQPMEAGANVPGSSSMTS